MTLNMQLGLISPMGTELLRLGIYKPLWLSKRRRRSLFTINMFFHILFLNETRPECRCLVDTDNIMVNERQKHPTPAAGWWKDDDNTMMKNIMNLFYMPKYSSDKGEAI